jgi:hypothetical protein
MRIVVLIFILLVYEAYQNFTQALLRMIHLFYKCVLTDFAFLSGLIFIKCSYKQTTSYVSSFPPLPELL